MASKLHQILAVVKGIKSDTTAKETELHRLVQKEPLLLGISRRYQPKDEDGDQLPSESTKVQVNAEAILQDLQAVMTKLFDKVAIVDWANCDAKADVIVDGKILLPQVPTTHLLFLDHKLTDLATFMAKLPVLDASETWHLDENTGAYATEPVQTVRTKKVPRNHVKAEATDKFPAQVDVFNEDVQVGTWTAIKFSGALPATRVKQLRDRVTTLQEAVKTAREAANGIEITHEPRIGGAIFGYLLAK